MGKQYLIRLIQKYRRGQATDAEQAQLDRWWQYYQQDDSYLQSLPPDQQEQLRDQMLARIWQQAEEAETEQGFKPIGRSRFRLAGWQVAASIVGVLIVAGLGGWFWWQQPLSVQTAYGQTQSLTLPDGSSVVLNGNSSLRYARQWADGQTRELWLDGEGFFDVKTVRNKAGQKAKFIVHTSQLDVNVVGTGFNVSDRHGRTSVVLQHGAVQVVNRTHPDKSVLLQPGERVVCDPNQLLTKERVDPKRFLTWRQRQLLFYNTRLADIFTQLEDSYGVRVVCDDPALLNETFSGAVPTDSLPLFFQKIEKLFAVGVTREGDTYRLR